MLSSLIEAGTAVAGRFCWVDLAATDAESAINFYGELFGWEPREQAANGGSFTRLQLAGQDVGSVFQLSRANQEQGVPSHWTPYIKVDDVDDVVQRAEAIGGKAIVCPFVVAGVARIALIVDPVGAHVGLWEAVASTEDENEQR
jgi:predicted enzyme related to lactoylglutathione lyase